MYLSLLFLIKIARLLDDSFWSFKILAWHEQKKSNSTETLQQLTKDVSLVLTIRDEVYFLPTSSAIKCTRTGTYGKVTNRETGLL